MLELDRLARCATVRQNSLETNVWLSLVTTVLQMIEGRGQSDGTLVFNTISAFKEKSMRFQSVLGLAALKWHSSQN